SESPAQMYPATDAAMSPGGDKLSDQGPSPSLSSKMPSNSPSPNIKPSRASSRVSFEVRRPTSEKRRSASNISGDSPTASSTITIISASARPLRSEAKSNGKTS